MDDIIRLLEQSFASGSQEAWEAFVRATYPIVAATVDAALRRMPFFPWDLRDDFVQDVYIRLCSNQREKLRRFCGQDAGALTAYLRTVASSVVIDAARSHSTKKRGEGKVTENLEVVSAYVPAVESSQFNDPGQLLELDIERCLNSGAENRERDRRIFWMYYREGLTAKAIADVPGIELTPKGVESTIRRLTLQIRDCLKGGDRSLRQTAKGNAG